MLMKTFAIKHSIKAYFGTSAEKETKSIGRVEPVGSMCGCKVSYRNDALCPHIPTQIESLIWSK